MTSGVSLWLSRRRDPRVQVAFSRVRPDAINSVTKARRVRAVRMSGAAMAAWGGRRASAARDYCQRVYGFTCWLCGQDIDPDDYSVDHVVERSRAPHLAWDPTNWRPAHGRKHPEFGCPGNFGRSSRRKPLPGTWTAPGW